VVGARPEPRRFGPRRLRPSETSLAPGASALRTFAVALYDRKVVQAACLALQDVHGLDVNVVLFAAWTGAALGRALEARDARTADEAVAAWRERVVGPLRSVRRDMKSIASGLAGGDALRAKVKAVELEAELVELDALDRLGAEVGEAAAPSSELALANIRTIVTALAREPGGAEAHVAAIAAAIGSNTDIGSSA